MGGLGAAIEALLEGVVGGEVVEGEGGVVVIHEDGFGSRGGDLGEEVFDEAWEGQHWFAGVLSNKSNVEVVFEAVMAGVGRVYNRGWLIGEVGSLSGSLSTWGLVEGDGCTIVEGENS